MHYRSYLNAIILLFVCIALPLWALPVYDDSDPVMARDLEVEQNFATRDIVPQMEDLQERFFGLIGAIGRVAGTAARAAKAG
jgi:hypothetical protein